MLAVNVPDDQFGDHRVVHRSHFAVLADSGVNAHAGPRRFDVAADLAWGGGEILRSVLGIDAALDRVAAHLDLILRYRQRLTGGGADSFTHDVDPGHHLGHAVLNLNARVHLKEEVFAVLQHSLDRSSADVADSLSGIDADLSDLRPQLFVNDPGGGRRLFDQLLVTALD
ncbi:unannotated protein [freshwater metagenome]|uniref:Unannotated protein n=1 Tax=freshwater metagenome TaxID=449393 RepID=A0A6J7RX59_9ZZZZ